MTGFVYAIVAGGDRVKIGWSRDPLKRLNKIRSDCPDEVGLAGIVAATLAQEQELHRLLDPWRISREWFRLEGPVVALLGMLHPPSPRPTEIHESDHPLRKWRKRNKHSLRSFGALVGCKQAHLCLIENREHRPSLDLWSKINAITGLPATDFIELRAAE